MNQQIVKGKYYFDIVNYDVNFYSKDKVVVPIYTYVDRCGSGLKRKVVCRVCVILHTFKKAMDAYVAFIKRLQSLVEMYDSGLVLSPLKTSTMFRVNGSLLKKVHKEKDLTGLGSCGYIIPICTDKIFATNDYLFIRIFKWGLSKRSKRIKKCIARLKINLASYEDVGEVKNDAVKKAKSFCACIDKGLISLNKSKVYTISKGKQPSFLLFKGE